MDSNQFAKNYSDDSFWEKVKGFAKTAGESVLEPALKMYYAASDPDTPVWAKAAIYAALGYFISPVDVLRRCGASGRNPRCHPGRGLNPFVGI